MTKRKANILLATIIFLSLGAGAQFRYTALLDTVKATGFYDIPITPVLSSYLKTDLSDLRIVDEKKQPVPFIIDIPNKNQKIEPLLISQNIIKKENVNEKTTLVIENPGRFELSNFIIELKSAAAERTASLSGSDDTKNWFVILDSLLLRRSGEYDAASHSQRINFPPGNYKYFKLTVYNGKKAPLNVLSLKSSGGSSPFDLPGFVATNPPPSFSQVDSGGYTLIKITTNRPYHIDKIRPVINGSMFYKRQAKVFTEIKPGILETWNNQSLASFTISSDQFSGYTMPLFKSAIFYLLIENGDNPPLQIDSISTEQINKRIIAELLKGRTYTLLLDNRTATAPNYDLVHFRERIRDIHSINIQNIIALPRETIPAKKQADKWWIWPVIILVLLILSILAWKLTADMKRTREDKAERI
jgi:hypothetical protein